MATFINHHTPLAQGALSAMCQAVLSTCGFNKYAFLPHPFSLKVKNVNLKKAYSLSEIRGVFRDAVKQQALIFAGQTGVDSRYGDPETAQQLAASHIASLTFEQRKEFVKVLLQQGLMTPEELLSDEPLKNKPTTS